jgi:hypothetical protein
LEPPTQWDQNAGHAWGAALGALDGSLLGNELSDGAEMRHLMSFLFSGLSFRVLGIYEAVYVLSSSSSLRSVVMSSLTSLRSEKYFIV